MNWTGGSLRRHTNNRSSKTGRTLKHRFGRAYPKPTARCTNLQPAGCWGTSSKLYSPESDFSAPNIHLSLEPSTIPQDSRQHSPDNGTQCISPFASTCFEANHVTQFDPLSERSRNHDFLNTFAKVKEGLLRKDDWSRIATAEPLDISFPPVEDLQMVAKHRTIRLSDCKRARRDIKWHSKPILLHSAGLRSRESRRSAMSCELEVASPVAMDYHSPPSNIYRLQRCKLPIETSTSSFVGHDITTPSEPTVCSFSPASKRRSIASSTTALPSLEDLRGISNFSDVQAYQSVKGIRERGYHTALRNIGSQEVFRFSSPIKKNFYLNTCRPGASFELSSPAGWKPYTNNGINSARAEDFRINSHPEVIYDRETALLSRQGLTSSNASHREHLASSALWKNSPSRAGGYEENTIASSFQLPTGHTGSNMFGRNLWSAYEPSSRRCRGLGCQRPFPKMTDVRPENAHAQTLNVSLISPPVPVAIPQSCTAGIIHSYPSQAEGDWPRTSLGTRKNNLEENVSTMSSLDQYDDPAYYVRSCEDMLQSRMHLSQTPNIEMQEPASSVDDSSY